MEATKAGAGLMFLVLAGFAGAGFTATTILTDGSAMLSSAGSDTSGGFSFRALALDDARIVRTMADDAAMEVDQAVRGTGPVLFSEYAAQAGQVFGPRGQCLFLPLTGDDDEEESVRYATGILHGGSVDSSGSVGSGLVAESSVNGSGMLLFGSALQGNRTMVSRGFVTGNLSVHDLIRQGGRV